MAFTAAVYGLLVIGIVTEFAVLNSIITKNGENDPEWSV